MPPGRMTDTGDVMDDGFNFGQPAKHPPRLGRSRPEKAAARSFDVRIVLVAAGLLIAGALAFVFLRGADTAGKRITDAETDTIAQVDKAHDAAAQASVGRAVVVAQTLHAERGTFTTDLATLSAFDPSIHFTSGASEGPDSVSYAATDSAFGAAVRSESDTCWWVKIDASGVTTYGSGTPCTGQAAMAAAAPTW
jgi:hypothetical protein